MSPAKYEGGKAPSHPHDRMRVLDDEGSAYWLEDIELINGSKISRAGVFSHSEQWLTVQETDQFGNAGPDWTLHIPHIVRFRIVEG